MGGRRTWTDQQLADAVEAGRTWKEVVTSIGLTYGGGALRTVTTRAMVLGLNVSHLAPGKNPPAPPSPLAGRRATDIDEAEARSIVEAATCWADVARALGFTGRSPSYRLARSIVAHYSLDTSHFRSKGDARPLEAPSSLFSAKVDEKHLRFASTATATQWFMRRGYMVSIPVEPAPYDLVVESDAGLQRVQVKSTTVRSRGRWTVGLRRSAYSGDSDGSTPYKYQAYDESVIDLFFVVCGDGAKYLIPIESLANQRSASLDSRYSEFQVPD